MSEPVFLDTKSILVSTTKGLKRLQVPFLVLVIVEIDSLKVCDKTTVQLVGFSQKEHLLYFIDGAYYKYVFFAIIDRRLVDNPQKP